MTTSFGTVLLNNLRGEWRIDRVMLHDDGKCYGWTGSGIFSALPDGDGLLLTEEGEMTTPEGYSTPSTARFLYRATEDALLVFYGDERRYGDELHVFPWPETGYPAAMTHRHSCQPDVYAAEFCFLSSRHFRTTYRVDGPGKAMNISSEFIKKAAL